MFLLSHQNAHSKLCPRPNINDASMFSSICFIVLTYSEYGGATNTTRHNKNRCNSCLLHFLVDRSQNEVKKSEGSLSDLFFRSSAIASTVQCIMTNTPAHATSPLSHQQPQIRKNKPIYHAQPIYSDAAAFCHMNSSINADLMQSGV